MMRYHGGLVECFYIFEPHLLGGSLEDDRAYQNMLAVSHRLTLTV
jgi:hypothetical protein